MKKRIAFVFYIFLVIVGVVIVRLVILAFSGFGSSDSILLTGNRGKIFDRNGNLLATSYRTYSLWVDSSVLSDVEKNYLSEIVDKNLGISKKNVLSKLDKGAKFVWIVRKVSEDKVSNVILVTNFFENKFGKRKVFISEEYVRRYPLGEKASTVVGSVNIDNEGISGFEYSFNDILLEKSGKYGNVVLTIDKYIQEIAYFELVKSVKMFEADIGMAVFANKNGEILAMVDYPSFDPNNLSVVPFSSRCVSYIIEPGSVMKIASAMFVLSKDFYVDTSKYVCDGSVRVFNHVIKEKAHGVVSLEDIIAYSCNVGMIKVLGNFDDKSFYFFLRSLGFGDKTLVGLPGEEGGILRIFSEWSGISKYMIGIGQEIGVTASQLLKLGLIIANDGKLVSPKLVKKILLPDGNEKGFLGVDNSISVVSKDVCSKVRKYMRSVVLYGTGTLAEIPNLRVAGKTGTGQIYNPKGGYYRDSYNAVFLGLLPFDDPKIVGVVVLVNPKKLRQGGMSAAPTFKNIVEKMVSYDPSLIQTQ